RGDLRSWISLSTPQVSSSFVLRRLLLCSEQTLMAAVSPSSIPVPRTLGAHPHPHASSATILLFAGGRVILRCCSTSELGGSCRRSPWTRTNAVATRRDVIGAIILGASSIVIEPFDEARGAGLPPEDKPKLCDATCEKELENVPMVNTESGLQYKDIKVGEGPSPPVGFQVAANCVAMVPSGQIFDSSLEKGVPYIFRVGSGQQLY
ncbi:Peptidyl-prolyl cis-trans isomerase FKBP16-3, chloroplastic, partial [Linum grandiflorum]